jgi:hypothetical protein
MVHSGQLRMVIKFKEGLGKFLTEVYMITAIIGNFDRGGKLIV